MNLFNLVHIPEKRYAFKKILALKRMKVIEGQKCKEQLLSDWKKCHGQKFKKIEHRAMILRYKFCDKAITEQNSGT